MIKNLVLLGHKMRRGKDTVGDYLCGEYGFTRRAFADEMKRVCGELYDLSWDQMYTDLKKEVDDRYGITPRRILQDFGQEQRARFPEIWVDLVARQIKQSQLENVVITDFRFPNEYTHLREVFSDQINCNIITVRIDRPELDEQEMSGSNNISETALNNFADWNLVINNNRTIEDLYWCVNAALVPILKR